MNQSNRKTAGKSAVSNAEVAIDLPIEGMTCASCVGRVESALRKVPGVRFVSVNLATERATIRAQGSIDHKALIEAVKQTGYAVRVQTTELAVEGMTCASCVGRVERVLHAVPGVVSASVNLATERATITGSADAAALVEAIGKAGYTTKPLTARASEPDGEALARKDAEREDLRRNFLIAAALALPVFVLEMGSHIVPAIHRWVMNAFGMQTSWYLQFILTTLILLLPGRRFFAKGIPALLRLGPDMNSLVAVGTLAAYAFSVVATFAPGWLPAGTVHVYYEAAAVIVALVLLGRYLEARAKGRTSQAIARLVGLQVKVAHVQRDGRVVCIFRTVLDTRFGPSWTRKTARLRHRARPKWTATLRPPGRCWAAEQA